MRRHIAFLIATILLPLFAWAQEQHVLSLPNLEQLSSDRVLQVIQDSEGFLWYATEGGGICRDDGRQMLVFRSDAEHPDLLGSNDVACIAEAGGRYIIIGTFHGANLLDKSDYSIRRLTEVDDKRVDDIVVSSNGHWWLTSNKKVYEYAADGQLLNVYPGGDKYIFRLHEDEEGRICGLEWEGGILRLEGGRLVRLTSQWPDNVSFSREMVDRQGRQLVADGFGKCYAVSDAEQQPWFSDQILTRPIADSIRAARGLTDRPTALAVDADDELWFSNGREIRVMRQGEEDVVLPDTKDVSAMTFTKDGTLWLATIFGTLMTYKEGKLATDEYASNEYGDAVLALQTDSLERLVLVSDRYIRLYDPQHKTLQQQSREADSVYSIVLQETLPNSRWSKPKEEVEKRMPQWVWWMLAALLLILSALLIYILQLHRQRSRFLAAMKEFTPHPSPKGEGNTYLQKEIPWLQKAIAHVEEHLSDENYNVEQLASQLCMSRMTFYRKIQSATGQKPTEFIRTIRLRRAAELLRQGHMTITEVSYATGFSSVSYFSRCFRTMFGVPPTQFCKTAEESSPAL
ncbi:MAG: helix-turn-helix transcriptional regulator [Bacteroidaceae bacterium]|nr:helix-turn-helix transcriptional regulator [Bacteroidaceae bacterium]